MVWVTGQELQAGKYTIDKELGEGGFGITYRAIDDNGRDVAIKTLNDTVQRHRDFAKFQQDFMNEAIKLAKCSHPHIVRIDEVIHEDDLWCIVMEYIDGEDLANLVEIQGVLPETEALRYIQQIGEALTVVHNHGMLHRDVKPQNIMVRSSKSEAVLIDFGIAREFNPNLTQTHTQILSDGFSPVEQYDKRAKRGAYTDVYALAATLYAILTGEVPTMAPMRAIGTTLVEPKEINFSISDRVNQAILKGMAIKPENRPQSMQEWLSLLSIDSISKKYFTSNSSNNFNSAVGIDYRKLQTLLADGMWWEADEETRILMLKMVGREKDIKLKEIQKIPCEDLYTINQLWLKYSDDKFGFSIQNSIWLNASVQSELETWCRFCDIIGWRVDGDWQIIETLETKVRSAGTKAQYILPLGYLPGWARYIGWGWYWSRFGQIGLRIFESVDSQVAFFSHLQKCEL